MFTGIDNNLDLPLPVCHALDSATIQDLIEYLTYQRGISCDIPWIHFTAKEMGLAAHGYGIHGSYLIPYHPEAYSLSRARKINSCYYSWIISIEKTSCKDGVLTACTYPVKHYILSFE